MRVQYELLYFHDSAGNDQPTVLQGGVLKSFNYASRKRISAENHDNKVFDLRKNCLPCLRSNKVACLYIPCKQSILFFGRVRKLHCNALPTSKMDDNLDVYTLIDNQNKPYLTFNVSQITHPPAIPINATEEGANFATFLSDTLKVKKRATSVFSTDLTNRDDVLLAILSLCLLLVVEGILTSILLRTYNGYVSNFGFSIKQFVELARDFKVRYLIWGKRAQNKAAGTAPSKKRKVNWRLLLVALLALTLTFGLEVAILYFSSPGYTDVYNTAASFTIEENFVPDWNEVRDNAGGAANRPCTALTIVSESGTAIEQGNTRITPCLSSTGNLNSTLPFERVTGPVEVEFITDTHEFGAEHYITIGELRGAYHTIIYFTLDERGRKIMRKRAYYFTTQASVFYKHQQFIAYLFNEYTRKTGDTSMNLESLQNLKFDTKVEDGPNVIIAQINKQERFRKVISTRHITRVTGIIPRGPPALRFAIAYLKGSTGLSVRGPDINDMDIGSSSTWGLERRMWQEESRQLNWLTLTITLVVSFVLLAILRCLLKPIGTAEIAGAFVTKQVGAQPGRAVTLMNGDERQTFSLLLHHGAAELESRENGFHGDNDSAESFSGVARLNDSYSDDGTR